jgi:hypothetical protein
MVSAKYNPINDLLSLMKPLLLPSFTKKWSAHTHEEFDNCNLTLTMDGNWKLGRPRCIFAEVSVNTEEFGTTMIGCRATPIRGGYYCEQHQSSEVKFKYKDQLLSINPTTIKATKLGKIID